MLSVVRFVIFFCSICSNYVHLFCWFIRCSVCPGISPRPFPPPPSTWHATSTVCRRCPSISSTLSSVPVPPITLLTDMHGLRSCPSARTQPLTASGAPSQTSTMPYHMLTHAMPPLLALSAGQTKRMMPRSLHPALARIGETIMPPEHHLLP